MPKVVQYNQFVEGGVVVYTKHWMLRATAHCKEGC